MSLPKLNFAENYQIRLKNEQDTAYIFCHIRKKWLVFTPEEWVRQHVIQYLTQEIGCNTGAMVVEQLVEVHGLKQRVDILAYYKAKPYILVECKRASEALSEKHLHQLARYNQIIRAEYLMLSNGLHHVYCKMDFENQKYKFLEKFNPVR